MFKEFEVVELTHDIKEHNLKEGEKGTIVEIYKGGKAYEIEFLSNDGKTSVLLTLISEDIRSILNKELYFSHNLRTPVYLSAVTISGTAVNLITDDILKDINTLNLEIKREIHKNKANTKEFYFPALL